MTAAAATPMAAIVCGMWDAHHCVSTARRVVELAPRMNTVLHALRARGALIIHAPGDCTEFYVNSPARQRAAAAPFVQAPVPFDWTWS